MGNKDITNALEALEKYAYISTNPAEVRKLEQERSKKLLAANLSQSGLQGGFLGGAHYGLTKMEKRLLEQLQQKGVSIGRKMETRALLDRVKTNKMWLKGGIGLVGLGALLNYSSYSAKNKLKSNPYRIRKAPKKK